MALSSYQDLEVWRRAVDWAEAAYRATQTFPREEAYGLTSQIRRAAVSVPSNIAEGAARAGTKEFLQFLGIARGSLAEAETLMLISSRLGFLDHQQRESLMAQSDEIGRMITGLRKSLKSKMADSTQ
ncbi:MAG: four helix bundle protein [Fimbriimonadaceae bacterium]|nr:four helix bundle protein [Fimbriimonadaceae bacterium]